MYAAGVVEKKSFWVQLREAAFWHTAWHFTGDPLLDYLTGHWRGVVVSGTIGTITPWLISHMKPVAWPWLVVLGLVIFAVAMFLWELAVRRTSKAEKCEQAPVRPNPNAPFENLGCVPFDYLPHESPFQHGWSLAEEKVKGSAPIFAAVPADSPIRVGLCITPTGWYGLDYKIREAHQTGCNRLRFDARFERDGRLYVLVHVGSRQVGSPSVERWVQMGVNIGPAHLEGDEGVTSISGTSLGEGWQSFEIWLDDLVNDTLGRLGFIYGKHGQLLKIRIRGCVSISPIELGRSDK